MIPLRTPILIMDDELSIRRLAWAFLKREGFEVVEAEDVPQAANAVREIPDLRMVLADLQTRAGTARDLHQQIGGLIEERRGLFVVTTGASFDEPRLIPYGDYFREHGVHVMYKPLRFPEVVVPFLIQFREQMAPI